MAFSLECTAELEPCFQPIASSRQLRRIVAVELAAEGRRDRQGTLPAQATSGSRASRSSASRPRVMQPFFVVNITVPSANSSGVYNCISQKGEQ